MSQASGTVASGTVASGTVRVFAYGTLRDPNLLAVVLGHVFSGVRRPAVIHGFRRAHVEGFDFPVIVREEGGRIDGILLEGLTEEDLVNLDAYEDVAAGLYDRVEGDVTVDGEPADAPPLKAFVYVAGSLLK